MIQRLEAASEIFYSKRDTTSWLVRSNSRPIFKHLSERHSDHPLEIGEIAWLVYIGECTKLKGLAGTHGVGHPAHHDHRRGRGDRTDSLEYLDAVRRAS